MSRETTRPRVSTRVLARVAGTAEGQSSTHRLIDLPIAVMMPVTLISAATSDLEL
jgi:hypothetical protein